MDYIYNYELSQTSDSDDPFQAGDSDDQFQDNDSDDHYLDSDSEDNFLDSDNDGYFVPGVGYFTIKAGYETKLQSDSEEEVRQLR